MSENAYDIELTLDIMKTMSENEIFREFKGLTPSDVVNLSLNILSLIVNTIDKNTLADGKDIEVSENLIDDNNKFAYYSLLCFAVSSLENTELNNNEVKESLLKRMEMNISEKAEGEVL